MILTGVWMGKYRGGFAWDGSGKEFNYHPLCMVIAFVFLYSEGRMMDSIKLCVNEILQFLTDCCGIGVFNVLYFNK